MTLIIIIIKNITVISYALYNIVKYKKNYHKWYKTAVAGLIIIMSCAFQTQVNQILQFSLNTIIQKL